MIPDLIVLKKNENDLKDGTVGIPQKDVCFCVNIRKNTTLNKAACKIAPDWQTEILANIVRAARALIYLLKSY